LEAAYGTSLALREMGDDPLSLLLRECALDLRCRISAILDKDKKKYTLELSRSEAAALHFYWIGQPIHSHDAGQAVNALLAAIDQYRKSPLRLNGQRLIPEVA
jgi:hypothetical protein